MRVRDVADPPLPSRAYPSAVSTTREPGSVVRPSAPLTTPHGHRGAARCALACVAAFLLACNGPPNAPAQSDGSSVGGNGGAAGSPAGDASADSGCGPDTNLMSDPDNCGSCGFRCCIGACTQGYCFCDGPPGVACCSTDERGADGCYFQSVAVYIATNSCNCGGCGVACPPGTVCSNATCVAADAGAGCQ